MAELTPGLLIFDALFHLTSPRRPFVGTKTMANRRHDIIGMVPSPYTKWLGHTGDPMQSRVSRHGKAPCKREDLTNQPTLTKIRFQKHYIMQRGTEGLKSRRPP